MYRWLSIILLGSIVLSVALIACTVVFVLLYENKDVTRVTSVLGFLSALISGVLYPVIRYYRSAASPARKVLVKEG